MSVVGSLLGLRCAVHSRYSRWPGGWLLAAAVAVGGCGIWVMHFTGMLGFAIEGMTIRYDVSRTLLSAAIAIVVVWLGLWIAVRMRSELLALPLGGAVTGLGVAAMHYIGMSAMKTAAHIEYEPELVAASIVIAVIAATVAFWFMRHLNGFGATAGAALIMGLAVCGMHYTGMASMRGHDVGHEKVSGGVEPAQLITPLITVVTLVTITLIVVVGLAEVDDAARREFDIGTIGSDSVESRPHWSTKPAPSASARTADASVSLRASSRAARDSGDRHAR
ncbi:MHYT domain-containing protein [Nocardia sp. CA-107356]|uniref:MHYT domain-containing protein n=1 Tax=Nocardia sp. CA-107356 TaxID=3239972 RepID=UPI003D8B5041